VGLRAVARRVATTSAFQSAVRRFKDSKWVLLGVWGERSRAPVQNFCIPQLA
jgi:hypothetical protein